MSNVRKILRRTTCLALVLIALTSLGGCALRTIRLEAQAGECLNPPEGVCDEQGANSIILAVQVYQLRTEVDVPSLDWEALTTPGEDLGVLGDHLTDPQDLGVVTRRFTLTTEQHAPLRLERRLRTRYLLLVAAGRQQSDASILLIRAPWSLGGRTLCVEYTDLAALPRGEDHCHFSFHATPTAVQAPHRVAPEGGLPGPAPPPAAARRP